MPSTCTIYISHPALGNLLVSKEYELTFERVPCVGETVVVTSNQHECLVKRVRWYGGAKNDLYPADATLDLECRADIDVSRLLADCEEIRR